MFGLGLGIGLGQNVAALSGGGGGAWTPLSLGAALKFWGDADQQTEIADAAVATFVDRSGNGNDFTQASAPNRPLLRHSAINGKKALDFDGISSNFTNSGLLNGATAGAWFAVIQLDADPPSNAGPIIDGFGAGDSVHPYTDGIIYDGFCTSVRKTCGNPTPSLTSVSLLGAISASADYRFYVNDKTTPFFSTGTNTVSVGTGTRYMGFSVALSSLISGLIPELIVMDAVPSAGDLTSLWAYVNTKYGTSF
jgi:hypothetical protein